MGCRDIIWNMARNYNGIFYFLEGGEMLKSIIEFFNPAKQEQKEYVFSKVESVKGSNLSTLYLEVTAEHAVISELNRQVTSQAYQILSDSVRAK